MDREWENFKAKYKGSGMIVFSDYGPIDFSEDGMKDVKDGEVLTYEQYLDAQTAAKYTKTGLRNAFFSCKEYRFTGEISRKFDDKVLFCRLYISGHNILQEPFSDSDDNILMDAKGFEGFDKGDTVSFDAEIFRFLDMKNKYRINYGLKNPAYLKISEDFRPPKAKKTAKKQSEKGDHLHGYLVRN